jgi:hypothetical protein
MKKIISLILFGLFFLNSFIAAGTVIKHDGNIVTETVYSEDFDPLVDINITIEISEIRALDKIDCDSDPDFFVKLIINEEEFQSTVWDNSWYLYDCWTVTKDVPDNVQKVNITIQLWDWNSNKNKICDINKNENINDKGFDINLVYDISSGRWTGDDYYIADGSGYGRVCGSGDGSIYTDENDCELWFDIYQNDYDNDGLPFWVETNVYGTDPTTSNKGEDADNDDIPIEWEHRFGFNPFIWDDHQRFDPDYDSITNVEEFLTFNFGSDPYRQDIFLEMDIMESGPDEQNISIANRAYELLKQPFHRRNIVFHIDDGEVNGGDLIPFDDHTIHNEAIEIYENYFIKNESDGWRRSVFHYGINVNSSKPAGYAFQGDKKPGWGYGPGTNSFIICRKLIDGYVKKELFPDDREYLYAANIMHEMGHNFGFRWGHPFGVDSRGSANPFKIKFWIFRNYKSIMNYRYTYFILDYSDGTHGRRDHDDWKNVDLSYFEIPNNNLLRLLKILIR